MLHHMATILVCYGGHFESKMAAKIQKSSNLGEIWFPRRFCSCELISVIVFGIGSHIMILQIISFLVILIPLFSSASILSGTFLGNRTADPFETWHKNRSSLNVVLFVFEIFKMTTNIKIRKIIKNSKMKRFQWKWIFTGSKTCCTISRPFWFAMAAILNPKWPPK